MPSFSYVAFDSENKKIKGKIEGAFQEEVMKKLIDNGYFVLSIKCDKKKHLLKFSLVKRLEFTQYMAQLLKAGLPVYESLISLKEKKVSYQCICDELILAISQGESLSLALSKQDLYFPKLYIAVIQAAEASGELEQGFYSLKILQEKQIKLFTALKNALTYPMILLGFALLVVLLLLFFIIPSLRDLFENRHIEGLTQFVLLLSDFCISHQTALIFSSSICLLAFVFCLKTKKIKDFIFLKLSKLPYISGLIFSFKLENFFSCLALLLSRSVNLKEALILAKNVLNHSELEKSVDHMISSLVLGKKLSSGIESPMPPVVKRLFGISEMTGNIFQSVDQLALLFREEAEKKLLKLTTYLQPILLGVIGLIIGFVVLSILIPLTDTQGFIE